MSGNNGHRTTNSPVRTFSGLNASARPETPPAVKGTISPRPGLATRLYALNPETGMPKYSEAKCLEDRGVPEFPAAWPGPQPAPPGRKDRMKDTVARWSHTLFGRKIPPTPRSVLKAGPRTAR